MVAPTWSPRKVLKNDKKGDFWPKIGIKKIGGCCGVAVQLPFKKKRGMLPHPPILQRIHLRPLVSDGYINRKVLFSKIFKVLQIIDVLTEPYETGIYPREYIPRDLVIGLRNNLREVLRQNPLLFIIIGAVLPYLDEVVFVVSGSEFSSYWHITLN